MQGAQKGLEIGSALSFGDVEDAMVLEVTEGGGEAASPVEAVFIDAENCRALARQALASLAACELVVDAFDGGGAQSREVGHAFAANTVVVVAVDALTEGLGGVPARYNAGQRLDECLAAIQAQETSAPHSQVGVASEALQMPDAAVVSALAVKARASTARAGRGPGFERFGDYFDLWLALIRDYSVSSNSYLTRGWGHAGHFSFWSRVPNL